MAQTTTDHDTIRKWAEARDGRPARVKGTGDAKDAGLLRLDFVKPEENLEAITGKSSSTSSRRATWRFSTKTSPTTGSASLCAAKSRGAVATGPSRAFLTPA